MTYKIVTQVGGTAAENTAWGSDAALVCKVAAQSGGSLRVSVTVGEQVFIYTSHPTPSALHPTPYTLHPTTLSFTPYTRL